MYIKMSKDSSAKYYQINKERLQKNACERYQCLSNEEKKAAIWLWTIQKSTGRWNRKACWAQKNIL